MSVTLNITKKDLSNRERWITAKNGDFVLISSNSITSGLYRVFLSTTPEKDKIVMLCPMYDGPFDEGMFPYILTMDSSELPILENIVHSIAIDIELINK